MSTAAITVDRFGQAPVFPATEDLDARRELALKASHELSCLARAAKNLLEKEDSDDVPAYLGILSRIDTLNMVIFHAMRLHGEHEPVQTWGDRDGMACLHRAFEGELP